MFNVEIVVDKNKIIGELIVDSYFFEPSKYDYAFYLYKDGLKLDVIWYDKTMNAVFNIEGLSGSFQLKCFIRDLQSKNVRSFKSNSIIVDA